MKAKLRKLAENYMLYLAFLAWSLGCFLAGFLTMYTVALNVVRETL